jgi:hypothetical protein
MGPQSALRRFCGDESGQGIIFAAATLLVLVGFLAFVFNIGRLLDRRTKMQIAADAAAYSGAMVEADAVSAIAYINSAMSQVYYNSLKYAVDMNESAVAAELEYVMSPQYQLDPKGAPDGPAWLTYSQTVYPNASAGLQQAKLWMLQLSQLENAIAIVAPRLVQEEMYAVAGRAGGERMSVYPSFRMFPSPDDTVQFSISCLGNGWLITNLANQQTLGVTLSGNTWDLLWNNDASSRDVKITQVPPSTWQIEFFQPPGSKVQEVSIEQEPNLGWVVSGTQPNPNGGPPIPMQSVTFTPVDVGPNGGSITWVQVSQGGSSQILGRGSDGNVYSWNSVTGSPTLLTSNQTTVGGVNVQVNVTNRINFAGGGSAEIGNPTVFNIGGARIVLGNPPNIATGFGPVWITTSGFNPNQFNISAGGFSLMPGNSNGRWNEHYNPTEEIWWRNRLVVMGMGLNNQPNQWEYDYEKLGALLGPEQSGAIASHAFTGSGAGYGPDSGTWPVWTKWFNPYPPEQNCPGPNYSMPYDIATLAQSAVGFGPPEKGTGISHALSAPPANTYYQTARCALCGGSGIYKGATCPACHALDNCYPNVHYTNVRVFVGDLVANSYSVVHLKQPGAQNFDDYYLGAPMFRPTTLVGYPSDPPAAASLPLVATADFFKWGVNIGVWQHAYNGVIVSTDTPMLFPSTREPPWGTVAIASARVGLSTADGGLPNGGIGLPNVNGNYLCQFSDANDRSDWCASSLQNLYYADVHAQLVASKNQVSDFDLDEDILQGTPVTAIDESGLSFLWSSILATYNYNYANDWMDRFNGQADTRVGQALRSMQNRQGATFDYGSAQLNQVVQH